MGVTGKSLLKVGKIQAMLDLDRIRAISLDLDDTLWPVLPTLKAAEAAQHRILAHRPAQRVGYQLYLFIKIARQRGVACIFQWHGAPSI